VTTENSKSTDEAQIRGLIEDRINAVRTKDINGLMFNHAPDVLSFDVINPLRYTGSDAVRKRAQEWFSLYQGPIGYEFRDLRITTGDDVAFCHLAFGGDSNLFREFCDVIRAQLHKDTVVALRGSAVTGERWDDGEPFDADGPGSSDLDLTLTTSAKASIAAIKTATMVALSMVATRTARLAYWVTFCSRSLTCSPTKGQDECP
jgi:ketosteroid isomerase-like protein